MKRRSLSANISLCCFIALSGCISKDAASAANSSSRAADAKARMQKKYKAAALLSSPQAAQMDGSQDSKHPPVAPQIVNSKTRAHQFLREGARLHRMGEYDEAERLFREAVALDPHNADGFFNLGALAEGRGDLINALSQYRAGLNIQPSDASLKDAVDSIEKRLAAGERPVEPRVMTDQYGNFRYPQAMFTAPNPTVGFSEPPVLNVTSPDTPELTTSTDAPPVVPADGNGPFQLNTTQNAAISSGTNFGALNANLNASSSSMPTLPVRQSNGGGRRVAGATLNAILNIGMRSALSGTGLHCPACRLLRF